jgi:hypothetical protein
MGNNQSGGGESDNDKNKFILDGPVTYYYYKDVMGKEILLLGDHHNNRINRNQDDNMITDKIVDLIGNLGASSDYTINYNLLNYYRDNNLKIKKKIFITDCLIK